MPYYERMKYAHERRDWVKMVDEKLPVMEAEASKLQKDATALFESYQSMKELGYQRIDYLSDMLTDCYAEAHRQLLRCIYYRGMREANRD